MKIFEKSILIVDDQPNNIKVLLDTFNENNFKIYVADSGKRALTTLENILPDLILLDVMMPGLDGFETCKMIKEIDKIKLIPVIFMTALDDVSHILKGFEAGGVDYITKPFKQVEVLARVNTHIALRQREKDLEKALDEIKTLRGIIPICANCKKIRDDEGFWNQVELYIVEHSEAEFTHGLCPDCARELYPQFDLDDLNKNKSND